MLPLFPSAARLRLLCCRFALCLGCTTPLVALAQAAATGTIEGRVLNATTGSFLNKARVSVAGSGLQTFTDSSGQFHLADVPAGEVRLKVFYTGLATEVTTVALAAGQTARHDFSLVGLDQAPLKEGEMLKLDTFVVAASRERTGAAIAINEQRFAPNVSTVVAADEFGDNVDGNPGEFLKFLPGITADTVGSGEPRVISVRGMPTSATPIMIDGFRMASASSSNQSRTVEFDQATINNMSRIEVSKSQTPDSPADAVGGSVNMISKRAFENSRPVFSYRLYGTARRGEASLNDTAGPGRGPSVKPRPGFDLSYIAPVTKNFGYTITVEDNTRSGPQFAFNKAWSPNSQAAGTGQTVTTADNPYLERYEFLIGKGFTTRHSLGLTLDYKFTAQDVVSFTLNDSYFKLVFDNRDYTFDTGTAVTAWGPTFTQGGIGKGSVSNQGPNSSSWREKTGTTWQPSLTYQHTGRIWKIEAGAAFSHASNHYRDTDKGFFQTMNLSLPALTLRYDGITATTPGTVTATNASGAAVDPFNLNSYRILSASSNPRETTDVYHSARISASRTFDTKIPFALKAGADVRENIRDIRADVNGRGPISYTFVGADHVANTADDVAGVILDDSYTAKQVSPFGLPHAQWPSPYKLYDLFVAHPDYFTTNAVTSYQNIVNNSVKNSEMVSSAYLRADAWLMNNRLWLVGGVRYERTEDKGEGVLTNRDAIYQRDAAGNYVLDGTGKKTVITTDLLEQAKLIFVRRGAHAKNTYGDFYPSLNATYNIAENFLARAAVGNTINRPDYNNIIPGLTLPDPAATTNADLATIRNPALKPWASTNYDLSLEYYFNKSAGIVSLGAFRRDISDFIATTTRTITADDFALYGVDPALYPNIAPGVGRVTTTVNSGTARVTGFEFNYKQGLTFLPDWARGVQIMANGTVQHVEGTNPNADFSGFIRQTVNAGISLNRERYSVKINWNHKGLQKQTLFTGVDFFNYQVQKNFMDVNLEYRPARNLTVFAKISNILNQSEITQRYNNLTPAYARDYASGSFVPMYVVGLKGTF